MTLNHVRHLYNDISNITIEHYFVRLDRAFARNLNCLRSIQIPQRKSFQSESFIIRILIHVIGSEEDSDWWVTLPFKNNGLRIVFIIHTYDNHISSANFWSNAFKLTIINKTKQKQQPINNQIQQIVSFIYATKTNRFQAKQKFQK